ncbi:hypothetical protein JAAARDRAFT_270513 [Jaapia argillacea MUCL 33604]|uniref:P-loop containing nucleoside triphosphate hydrolase protein n=1 Tax=Jaapia argillacea MUCL 33604 TaxID=933084 RepID=A0A067PS45_9AGAM|nr:hypothetical protein JAAARDRAFT_270513 [Jaapia argillacea MUCL 33604]
MSRPPCRFYNSPGGCRSGTKCTFAHVGPDSGGNRVLSQGAKPDAGPRPSPRNDPTNSPSPSNQAPPGACRFFWSSGRCKFDFGCRYKHIQAENQERSGVDARSSSSSQRSAFSIVAPFLTPDGLAKLTGVGTDGYFSSSSTAFNPSEAQIHLSRFLRDDYRFRDNVAQVYAFMKVVESANVSNSAWTQEDGQLLLKSLSTGNGLLRLLDVVRWPVVANKSSFTRRDILSFQRGYLPLLRYLSSDFVVKSTLSHLVNGLYSSLILENLDHFSTVVSTCIDEAVAARTFRDTTQASSDAPSGAQVFASLSGVLFECLTRYKNVVATHAGLVPLVLKLQEWTDGWIKGISATPPTFIDTFKASSSEARDHITSHLSTKVNQLVAIVNREKGRLDKATTRPTLKSGVADSSEAIGAALWASYEGPGEERHDGARHDNDHIDIDAIRIAPTDEELKCRIPPFLPANLYGAPHPHPPETIQRLLDIQFRLLREELTAPLRTSIQLILEDLQAPPRQRTRLSDLLEKGGGKYRSYGDRHDSIMFNLYTGVEFLSLAPDRRGISVNLTFDAPPGRARSKQSKVRTAFWEGIGGKRLMQGGLVALVWKTQDVAVHLGIVASSTKDLTESAKGCQDKVEARIVFFDSTVDLRVLDALRHTGPKISGTKILIEAPVMFEAIRPFLEALRVPPETVPFPRYLVHQPPGGLKQLEIKPPAFASVPGFSYRLDSLFEGETGEGLRLDVRNPDSVALARQELMERSRLDPSQALAVVDALTRELALIQGPPGTGKSYTGVELLRVLLANKIRPILMIAFTNHALDHMLLSVLDANITKSIVRLGSRSTEERLANFNIETLEMVAGKSRLDRMSSGYHRAVKEVEGDLGALMKNYLRKSVEGPEMLSYLEVQYPEHSEHFKHPPSWVSLLYHLESDSGPDGEWQQGGRKSQKEATDKTIYGYWRNCLDIEFLRTSQESNRVHSSPSAPAPNPTPVRPPAQPSFPRANQYDLLATLEDEGALTEDDLDEGPEATPEERWMNAPLVAHDEPSVKSEPLVVRPKTPPAPSPHPPIILEATDVNDLPGFFAQFGYDGIPILSTTDKPLEALLEQDDVWSMSVAERGRLNTYWIEVFRINAYQTQTEDFERLRRKHAEALRQYNEGRDEARRNILQSVDIIGCTTTGAAKLTSLLKGICPRVALVEEAGQVLEAHILASLVPSVQSLILIGDPLQLRPTLNNFALSMDNRRGRELYKFDMSLMERLSMGGIPMSQIDVQRRMRPAISSLIRNTLYPKLVDHELVKSYPAVRGGDESASKSNVYEVQMIKDLVLYLLRQGCYSREGDIVVLCAYLGQLARMRDALSDSVAVVIDERDQTLLADHEEEKAETPENALVEHVRVSKRVLLRTIDNFQGEEAKIVILSLVRNSGGQTNDDEDQSSAPLLRTNIGFLKSDNRTNVALSRAREGLFILGNGTNMASRSKMWRAVMEELEKNNAVGHGFPIVCHRHPDVVEYVGNPGELPRIAPDGGCLKPCDSKLKCGHLCPYKCHSDDPSHVTVICDKRCLRLCPQGHPCNKQCADACGNCLYPVSNVELPCGHTTASLPCHFTDNISEVFCSQKVMKKLLSCEHSFEMPCSQDPASYHCHAGCDTVMHCCGRTCTARCADCTPINQVPGEPLNSPVRRTKHARHPCLKTLHCEHTCQNPCSDDHTCTTVCMKPCRQVCVHARCSSYCSSPCSPCQEPCPWTCPHFSCPVPCGSICARLPCDARCEAFLACGHRCPSVCGEDCAIQVCPNCAPPDTLEAVVDFIMQRPLKDINPELQTMDELLITNPTCRHTFTVETLDGHCDMELYYERSPSGTWTNLSAPPLGFKKPPTCPTCRAAITSPRYGRVYKRADLDILEKNVAFSMSRSRNDVLTALEAESKTDMETRLRNAASNVTVESLSVSPNQYRSRRKERMLLLKQRRYFPVPMNAINPRTQKFHGISQLDSRAWWSVTRPLLRAYEMAEGVAQTRSAHARAWEAAFACLFHREMDRAVLDPTRAPRNPDEHSMRMARMMVGQPKPQADKRFCVEAFWDTINIRFTLADLARAWLEVVSRLESYPANQRRIWADYISFLLRSCLQDALIAVDIAREAGSHRQVAQTSLLCMRAELECFRFNVHMTKQTKQFQTHRQDLVASATRQTRGAEDCAQNVSDEYRGVKGTQPQEEEWLRIQFCQSATAIIEEWRSLGNSIRLDTFYQPVSLEEKIAIVKALNFSHTGHYYQCPKGHMFVITECGGAMEVASCPECGERIGGTGHNLLGTNTGATEFETIAREHVAGTQRSPWPWAR